MTMFEEDWAHVPDKEKAEMLAMSLKEYKKFEKKQKIGGY